MKKDGNDDVTKNVSGISSTHCCSDIMCGHCLLLHILKHSTCKYKNYRKGHKYKHIFCCKPSHVNFILEKTIDLFRGTFVSSISPIGPNLGLYSVVSPVTVYACTPWNMLGQCLLAQYTKLLCDNMGSPPNCRQKKHLHRHIDNSYKMKIAKCRIISKSA